MKDAALNLIAISYAKRVLEEGSREQRRMVQYAKQMQQYHVIVFTRRADELPAQVQVENLRVYGTNTRTRWGMLWAAYRIGRGILRRQSDAQWVVSSQDPFETSMVGRALARPSHVRHHIQIHGDVFNPLSYSSSWLQRLRVMYGRYVVRQAAALRVVSSRIACSLAALGVAPDRITILPIASDLQTFFTVGEQRVYTTQAPVHFLYVGRFSPEKNIPLLIEAFAAVVRIYPTARLTLVGDGPLRQMISDLVVGKQLGESVAVRSWTNDVSGAMQAADVFCLASNHEGWAMVLVEAAAAGLPVVTTDVGCAGERVLDAATGRVVPVGDVEAFAAAMESYCAQPALLQAHGRAGRGLAADHAQTESAYVSQFIKSYGGEQLSH